MVRDLVNIGIFIVIVFIGILLIDLAIVIRELFILGSEVDFKFVFLV